PLSQADVVSVKQGSPIRGTVRDDFSDRTYQQTITGHVYYVDVPDRSADVDVVDVAGDGLLVGAVAEVVSDSAADGAALLDAD
ncbi:hypothetical protein C6A85_15750, partial [Mycobacterium sp. ITM-2017-0098]